MRRPTSDNRLNWAELFSLDCDLAWTWLPNEPTIALVGETLDELDVISQLQTARFCLMDQVLAEHHCRLDRSWSADRWRAFAEALCRECR